MSTHHHVVSGWGHLAGAVAGLTTLLALLLIAFAWPAANLQPRELPIAVAGPDAAVEQVEESLSQAAGEDAFDVHVLESRSDAVAAIEEREVYGALVVSPEGSEMLTASAASAAVSQLLGSIAAEASAGAPEGTPPVKVTDVAPHPADDPRGAALAAGSLPLVLGGIVTAALLALRVSGRSRQVVGAVGVAALAGLALTALLQLWLGTLEGSYLANAAVMALGISAVSLFILGLRNVLGVAGLGLGAATILLLGNPLSGISSAPEMLPDGWGTLGQWLPPGATGQALRSTAFFDGAGLGSPLWVLGIWVVAGLALMTIGSRDQVRVRSDQAGVARAVEASRA